MMIAQASIEHLPIADNSIDLVFTDPPYPRKYLPCYGWLAQEAARVLKPGGFVLAMCGGSYLPQIYAMFEESGLTYFYEFQHKVNGPAPVVYRHNGHAGGYPIIARVKPILAYSNSPGRPRVANILNLFETVGNWDLSKMFHHWGQDIASARYFIDYFSGPGDLVLDPFIGGGTTAVACELIGRRCIALDIDPAALQTTRERLAGADIPHQGTLFHEAKASA